MNLRQVMKLNKCAFSRMDKIAYDNPHVHRLSLAYGPKDSPYHDAVMLSDADLKDFLKGIELIRKEIKGYMKSSASVSASVSAS